MFLSLCHERFRAFGWLSVLVFKRTMIMSESTRPPRSFNEWRDQRRKGSSDRKESSNRLLGSPRQEGPAEPVKEEEEPTPPEIVTSQAEASSQDSPAPNAAIEAEAEAATDEDGQPSTAA